VSVKAAVWLRVSTDAQERANQEAGIAQLSDHHSYQVVKRFELDESAWNSGKVGGAYKTAIQAVLDGAHRGEFSVLIVWALDRITREGAEGALRLVRQLSERGVTLVSVQESWLSAAPGVQDILVAFAGWMAQQESNRRSERIRAGLARRRAEGKAVGRQPGSRDHGPRKRSGYVAAWEEGGERLRAASAKYDPLREFLAANGAQHVHLGMDEIAALVDGGLPASAYQHRMWWANTSPSQSGHVQARAWQRAGYEVTSVDFPAQRVWFKRKANGGR